MNKTKPLKTNKKNLRAVERSVDYGNLCGFSPQALPGFDGHELYFAALYCVNCCNYSFKAWVLLMFWVVVGPPDPAYSDFHVQVLWQHPH